MKKTDKTPIYSAIITGIFGIVAALISLNVGENRGEQNSINQVNSLISTVNGDNNEVTINNVEDLVNEYLELVSENKSLTQQNMKYFDELSRYGEEAKDAKQLIDSMPSIQFKNIGLSIDGEIIPIDLNNSSVVINDKQYYSEDFIYGLVNENSNMFVQDDIFYIGKKVKEKSNLFNEWILDQHNVDLVESITDSYGNIRKSAMKFTNEKSYIIFNLNNNYSFIKCNISIRDNADLNKTGIITIKADDVVVYTSPILTKTTKPFDVSDIPINNCSLLVIEYDAPKGYNSCILSDAMIYN